MRHIKTFEEIAIMTDPATTAAMSYLADCDWDIDTSLGNCAFFAKDFCEWCHREGIDCTLAYLKQDESFTTGEIEDHIVPIVAGKMIDFVYTDYGVSRRARLSNEEESLRRQSDPEITDIRDFEKKYSKWGYRQIEEIAYEEAYEGESAICQTIEYPERIEEDINIPINVGDTILGGRFKNKKTIVKKIGKNAKGDITVNGKPLLKYRLVKESIESFEEETNDLLRSAMDIGFAAAIDSYPYSVINLLDKRARADIFYVRIYKQIGDEKFSFNSPEFEWSLIKADVQAYIGYMTEELGYEVSTIYTIGTNAGPSKGYVRLQHQESEILEDKELGMIKCISIEFKK